MYTCDKGIKGMSNSEVIYLYYEVLSGVLGTVRPHGLFPRSKLQFIICFRDYILHRITWVTWLYSDVIINSNTTHKSNHVDLLL